VCHMSVLYLKLSGWTVLRTELVSARKLQTVVMQSNYKLTVLATVDIPLTSLGTVVYAVYYTVQAFTAVYLM